MKWTDRTSRRAGAPLLAVPLLPLFLLLLALVSTPASSTANEDTALDAVKQTLARAADLVSGEADRNTKLRGLHEIAGELLDAPLMARRAAGPVLAEQPEALRNEFLALYESLIIRAYLQKLLFFRAPSFSYVSDEPHGEGGRRLVETEIETRKDRYAVDYVMRQREGRWWAIDVLVEQASITRNYHRQFQRLLRNQSFEELVARMRRKVDRLAAEDAEERDDAAVDAAAVARGKTHRRDPTVSGESSAADSAGRPESEP